MTSGAGNPFRVLQASAPADAYDSTNPGQAGIMIGAKLTAAGAAATARLEDQNSTVLVDLAAPANGSDALSTPVVFRGKVRVAAMSGAGAVLNVWIE